MPDQHHGLAARAAGWDARDQIGTHDLWFEPFEAVMLSTEQTPQTGGAGQGCQSTDRCTNTARETEKIAREGQAKRDGNSQPDRRSCWKRLFLDGGKAALLEDV